MLFFTGPGGGSYKGSLHMSGAKSSVVSGKKYFFTAPIVAQKKKELNPFISNRPTGINVLY